jgi:hypothetical protein
MFRTVFPSIIRSPWLYIQRQVYVIQVCWLLASGPEFHLGPASKQSINLYDIYLTYVQSRTPDDGRKDRPKHVEWYSANSKNCASSWFYYRKIGNFVRVKLEVSVVVCMSCVSGDQWRLQWHAINFIVLFSVLFTFFPVTFCHLLLLSLKTLFTTPGLTCFLWLVTPDVPMQPFSRPHNVSQPTAGLCQGYSCATCYGAKQCQPRYLANLASVIWLYLYGPSKDYTLQSKIAWPWRWTVMISWNVGIYSTKDATSHPGRRDSSATLLW